MALTDGLLAYWKLDETSGTRQDSTANNVDLTDNNSVGFTTGVISNAADFGAGTSKYLSRATGAELTVTDFTVAGWVKTANNDKSRNWMYAHRDDANAGNGRFDVLLLTATAAHNSLYFQLYDTEYHGFSANTALSNDTWYHFAATYDGTTMILYLNGSSDGSLSYSGTFAGSNQLTLLGAQDTGPNAANGLNGALDEVGVWSRALDSSEISQLYNGGAGLAYPFTGFWQFTWKYWQ